MNGTQNPFPVRVSFPNWRGFRQNAFRFIIRKRGKEQKIGALLAFRRKSEKCLSNCYRYQTKDNFTSGEFIENKNAFGDCKITA